MALNSLSQSLVDRFGGGNLSWGLNTQSQGFLDDYINTQLQRYSEAQASPDQLVRQQGESGMQGFSRSYGELSRLLSGTDIGADNASLLTDYIQGRPYAENALREFIGAEKQRADQGSKLNQFADSAETELFGGLNRTLSQALSDPNSRLGDLGNFLASQQDSTFQRNLRPLIEQRLAAQGILDSGANVELQAKALGDLEQNRQANLQNAGNTYKDSIIGLRQSNLMGDLASQQQQMGNMFDLQRQASTMQYQSALQEKQNQLARELASISQTGPGLAQQIMGFGGAAAAGIAAPFTGGMSLAAMPGFLGMAMGPGGAQGGAGMSALGQSFFTQGGKAPGYRGGGSIYGQGQTQGTSGGYPIA